MLLVDDQGGMWSRNPDALDAYVFHPRTRIAHGRPHWMSMGGLRAPFFATFPVAEEPVLIQALVAGESADAIPLDHAIWWPGEPMPALMLRPGNDVIRAVDRAGNVLHRADTPID